MPWVILIIAGVLVIVEVILIFVALYYHRRVRWVRETPTVTAKELMPGPAKLHGQALALAETLEAPMSGKSCVYFRFKVEEKQTTAGPHGARSHWRTVVDDKQSVLCGIDDGTGVAAVSLAEAELVLRPDGQFSSGLFNSAPPDLEQVLQERYGKSTKGWFFNKTMRYTETLIEVGDPLVAVGTVELTTAGHGHLRKVDGFLLVSDRSEAELAKHYRTNAVLCWVAFGLFGTIAAFLCVLVVLG